MKRNKYILLGAVALGLGTSLPVPIILNVDRYFRDQQSTGTHFLRTKTIHSNGYHSATAACREIIWK